MPTRLQTIKQVSIVNALMNTLLALFKTIIGGLGMSPALFADGIHSFADVLCDGIIYVAGHYADEDPDSDHPYGHWRYETFATIALAAVLVAAGLVIGYNSLWRLFEQVYGAPSWLVVWAAIISVATNEWLFRYTLKAGQAVRSDMLQANAYHSRSDSLTSLIVLVGVLASFMGLHQMDVIAAALVGLYIVKMGVTLGWRAIYELTESGVDVPTQGKISDVISSQPGVWGHHQLRTRHLAGKVFLDVHINIAPYISSSEGHYIGEHVRAALYQHFPDIEDVIVHVDTEDHPEGQPQTLLPNRDQLLNTLVPRWNNQIDTDEIYRLTLHYFNISQHVELEISLPLRFLAEQQQSYWQQIFNESVRDIGAIQVVRLFFI